MFFLLVCLVKSWKYKRFLKVFYLENETDSIRDKGIKLSHLPFLKIDSWCNIYDFYVNCLSCNIYLAFILFFDILY